MPPDGANRGHYRNPALDVLLDQQAAETDREKRKAIVARIQEIVAEDEPYITLWYYDNICVHRNRVTDMVIPPGGEYDFLESAKLK
jgi:peptide/nickel transport system substrate-binding protein